MTLIALVLAAGFTLSPESRLWIEGDSNIHPWSCTAKRVTAVADTEDSVPRKLDVSIATADLDCGNGTMNDKLREALKTDKIEYVLSEAKALPAGTGIKLKATGSLTIAGVSKSVTMVVNGSVDPDGAIRAHGSVPVLMSEYGVERPSAMFGAIKTYDRVLVKFELRAVPAPGAHASR